MPTLYTYTESNIRKSYLLIILSIIFFTSFLGLLGFCIILDLKEQKIIEGLVLLAALFSSIYYSLITLGHGDEKILSMIYAKLIKEKERPELYKIIENLCITAGLPIPIIYILNEEQPNIFSIGKAHGNAAIVFTQGLLEKLDKQELEGVIAHELSHVGNRDIFLGMIVANLLRIIENIYRKDMSVRKYLIFPINNIIGTAKIIGFALLFSIVMVSIALAPSFAKLLQVFIFRKREFLADANAVFLTRYPEGLARALEKISSYPFPLKIAEEHPSINHLFIVNPLRKFTLEKEIINERKLHKLLFSSSEKFDIHPPIDERIKILRDKIIGGR
jgi:heat shock protein HtpX